ncbi:hypothetical protein R1sor_013477 [Riccia sorocarpa]|uniref:Uncharacterized protein n=1 Tax=Riccia sorocarpa TaxID=122646 RepID=A0ABD3H6P2_9MARC
MEVRMSQRLRNMIPIGHATMATLSVKESLILMAMTLLSGFHRVFRVPLATVSWFKHQSSAWRDDDSSSNSSSASVSSCEDEAGFKMFSSEDDRNTGLLIPGLPDEVFERFVSHIEWKALELVRAAVVQDKLSSAFPTREVYRLNELVEGELRELRQDTEEYEQTELSW